MKVLVWDRNGFWLHYKRRERGTFERLKGRGEKFEIERAQMSMLLEGIDTKMSRFRRHFSRDVRMAARDEDGGGLAQASR